MTIDDLIDNFSMLDNWEDKYRYLIELGEEMDALAPEWHKDEWKVEGCQSQVWLVPIVAESNGEKCLCFKGDSDAAIVKGLIAVVLTIFSGKTAAEIAKVDLDKIFDELGLHEHLSPSRRNGLGAMVEKIKFYAKTLG